MTSKLDAIAARLEAATKGPWEPTASLYPDGTYHDHVTAEWDIEVDICEVPRTPQGSADADLIAHAPADLAALLAVVREVAALNDQYMRGEISATALSIDIHAALAALTEGETEKPCNCGFGGTHDPDNPRCVVNDPTEAWLKDAKEETDGR